MNKPDTPQEEEVRLKALRALNILDTAPDERFDRLTRMAKYMFDVPIALVSLVDKDRQWFKSSIGLDVSETPREISFCGHAILQNDVMVVPDATLDKRFFDNPLVTGEPYIRFYAGCPIRLEDGSAMGTLCIIDRKPRTLSQDDLTALKDLAYTVERELHIMQMATLDELTNIANRRGFDMIGQHSLNLCAREDIPASLAYMDLDKLKPINDTYGHKAGDNTLIEFAHQISAVCRESDLHARLGGDEFVILFINSTRDKAEQVIHRLRASIEEFNRTSEMTLKLSFSYGIVEFDPKQHGSIEELLKEGDALMYLGKKDNSQQAS